ncbi:MAG: TIGR03936 family radical SAM-associated protein [Oscillospiraceae bacterium]|nr:TIGR03936 family radical SAM-associated protein [Oscillospiraceae bacterium]
MPDFKNIRVFFSKCGNAKYISHLDLYRAMSRAVKRSAIPAWITEGFNPHVYMTFALPLALGIEGGKESVDLRITEDVGFDELSERLDSSMPPGLRVLQIDEPFRKAAEIKKAGYAICGGGVLLEEYLHRPEIKIEKKTKRSCQIIDVKPFMEWDNGVMTLPAGNELNINPWNLLNSLDGVEVTGIKRVAILCSDGEEFR